MENKEQQQLKNWVCLKREEHKQNEVFFSGKEKGYPRYLELEGISIPFYLYTTSNDGAQSIYYGVDEDVIELELTPYDFSDEKRMLLKLMEKRAKKYEEKIQ